MHAVDVLSRILAIKKIELRWSSDIFRILSYTDIAPMEQIQFN